MRPALFDALFAPADTLSGVGSARARLLSKLLGRPEGARVVDVLFHPPLSAIDRRAAPSIRDAIPGRVATVKARVVEHFDAPSSRSKAPFKVLVEDETGDVELVFFLANAEWIRKRLEVGATRWISGKLEIWDGHRQMVHPDKVLNEEEFGRLAPAEPVYGLTEGLHMGAMIKTAQAALTKLPDLPEWLDEITLRRLSAPSFAQALQRLHNPTTPGDADPAAPERMRLAYDELLSGQLALALVRARMRGLSGRAHIVTGGKAAAIEAALPFRLTDAQREALEEIRADVASPKRMLRLLQGDVGSGKTIVALLAMSQVIEAGRQAVMMAPTEILARQHFERLRPLCAAAGIRILITTGRDKPAERRGALAAFASGEVDLVIGTHAVFQPGVEFRDLGMVVVDEQHRFGVQQRLALTSKGESVDLLMMTATPIPRTLVLTHYGDMDVSAILQKPPGRTPIDTRAMPLERLDDIVARIGPAIERGARAYWICPLVEESEDLDVSAVQDRAEVLRTIFGSVVGLVHGRMKGGEKDAEMAKFQAGETKILVATTVVEVGVDVPEATIMIIEHAERFGLAQLHQLRGRVGRGGAKSSCVLLYKAPLGAVARSRIEILRETEDGFRIAEEDLRHRGEGEVLGVRQSGLPSFVFAQMEHHGALLTMARDNAREVLEAAPRLAGEANRGLRALLYLFEREEGVRLMEAG